MKNKNKIKKRIKRIDKVREKKSIKYLVHVVIVMWMVIYAYIQCMNKNKRRHIHTFYIMKCGKIILQRKEPKANYLCQLKITNYGVDESLNK